MTETQTADPDAKFVTTSLSPEDQRRIARIQESVRPVAGDIKIPQAIRIALTAWESLVDRNWWVINRDLSPDQNKISGPYSTSEDAAKARTLIERLTKGDVNYWVEQIGGK